jgi:RNA-directed DNA polymerase
MDATANVRYGTTDWQAIDWRQAHQVVRNLRQRIFKATARGDWKRVRSLQKLLLRSWSNRAVSVRKVTQCNQGKNTPGVDRVLVKTPQARGALIDALKTYTPEKVHPTKRVYIPKTNGQRPLGIPTMGIFAQRLEKD